MNDYVIIADATLDLPVDVVKELDLHVIPMAYDVDGDTYYQYGEEKGLSDKDFYDKLRQGSESKTAQITPFVFEKVFKKYLDKGMDVICVLFSSGISGTYHSGCVAANILSDEYKDNKIKVIDSLCGSVGYGLLLYEMAVRKKENMTFDEVYLWTMNNRKSVRHWFCVNDLFHLMRGGRVSALSATLGTALKIAPVLSMNEEGKLIVVSKVRGNKKAVSFIVDKLYTESRDLENATVIICNADNLEMANNIKEIIEPKVKKVIVGNVGAVIGTHVGPGMFGMAFLGK